ncbi:MAG: DUF167 domain-containing protein [Microcoleaceae cyanobacterium]
MTSDPLAILKIRVKPNSRQQAIQAELDGSWTACLKSPPIDGKANQELIKLLAKQFNVPKSQIVIKSGLTSRHKLVELPDSSLKQSPNLEP